MLDILDYSQSYFESNCNAACNNFSALGLSALEIGIAAQKVSEEEKKRAAIMKNLEQQLSFSIQKQKKSIARLQQIV